MKSKLSIKNVKIEDTGNVILRHSFYYIFFCMFSLSLQSYITKLKLYYKVIRYIYYKLKQSLTILL